MKRTVEDPNRFVKPPMCSSPIVISGCRPFHINDAMRCPEGSVMVVRRRLRGVREKSPEDHELEEDGFSCESLQVSTASSTVVIEYARSLDVTSMRVVFSRSAVVNLSNMLMETGM